MVNEAKASHIHSRNLQVESLIERPRGKQKHGINFWETYAPVVSWESIRLFLAIALQRGWHTRQIDFVLAYLQAEIECPMYMEIPQGFSKNGTRKTHCLRLKKNLYGTKQAGQTRNKHIHKGLIE